MLTVRYYASAKAAAGLAEEVMPGATLGALRATLIDAHGDRLASVLSVASFLVNGVAWRDHDAPLPADGTVDVLPPFAGG